MEVEYFMPNDILLAQKDIHPQLYILTAGIMVSRCVTLLTALTQSKSPLLLAFLALSSAFSLWRQAAVLSEQLFCLELVSHLGDQHSTDKEG